VHGKKFLSGVAIRVEQMELGRILRALRIDQMVDRVLSSLALDSELGTIAIIRCPLEEETIIERSSESLEASSGIVEIMLLINMSLS